MTIKGVRRREGDMLHWISVLFAGLRRLILRYENVKHSYVYKTFAQKACSIKIDATLAMPNIFSASVVVCLCVVCRMWTFLCPD